MCRTSGLNAPSLGDVVIVRVSDQKTILDLIVAEEDVLGSLYDKEETRDYSCDECQRPEGRLDKVKEWPDR